MKSFIIQKGTDTPYVSLDPVNNVFEFKGDSYSQDPMEFYTPVIDWLKEFLPQNAQPITVNFHFTYFNTPTYPSMMEILQLLEKHHLEKKVNVTINWYVSTHDPDMISDGNFLNSSFDNLNIQIHSVAG